MALHDLTRRGWIGGAAAATTAAVFSIVPAHVLGGPDAPSNKLNIAGVGVGGQGGNNLACLEKENIVALCDVDPDFAAKTIAKYPKAKLYTDYRQMLDKQKDIDAVVIATPDHTHAVITMTAMKAGKHVYTQKPLTHDIYEARTLAKAAKETGVITMMGIQGHSLASTRLLCELVWTGFIGEVREVDFWCNASYYPWGHVNWSPKSNRPAANPPPPPARLDWDLWLGPARYHPYDSVFHPTTWRAWLDFGNGLMGDRGAHTLNPVFWALKLGMPTSVDASSLGQDDLVHPIASVVTFQFPARDNLPPVKVTWYEGMNAPRPPELEDGRKMGDSDGGAILKGAKGSIMCGTYGNTVQLIPHSRMKDFQRPTPMLPRIKGTHEAEWARCCKAGEQPGANFDYSARLTEVCLLGNLARRMNTRIEWDAANMKVTNLPQANQYVRTEYRKGWSL